MLPYSLSCVAIVLVACALAVAHAAPNSLHCSCKAGADEDHAQLTFNASINNPPPLGNRYWIAYYEPGASCENQLARTVLPAYPRSSSINTYFPLRSKAITYECALFQSPELVPPGDVSSCNLVVKDLVSCPPNNDPQNHTSKMNILIGAGIAGPLGIIGVGLVTWVIYRNARNRKFVEEYRVEDKNLDVALDSSESDEQYAPLTTEKPTQVDLDSASD